MQRNDGDDCQANKFSQIDPMTISTARHTDTQAERRGMRQGTELIMVWEERSRELDYD